MKCTESDMLQSYTNVETVEDAWRLMVKQVLDQGARVPPINDPLSIGSSFGSVAKSSVELLGTRIEVANPRARLIGSAIRKVRLSYAIAQAIWVLSGSDDISPLAFYNNRGYEFSDDGSTLRSAIGRRVFASSLGDQLAEAVKRIRSDSSTRRALIQVFKPDDLFVESRDVSCIGSLHFLAREGKLHAVAQMRSQSVLMVLPYDAFVLTMLQEMAAVMLQLEVGEYIHVCNSAHIYEDEVVLAKGVTNERRSGWGEMPRMDMAAVGEISRVVSAEKEVRDRLYRDPNDTVAVESFGLCEYWTQLLRALVADWIASRHHLSQAEATVSQSAIQLATRLGIDDSAHV